MARLRFSVRLKCCEVADRGSRCAFHIWAGRVLPFHVLRNTFSCRAALSTERELHPTFPSVRAFGWDSWLVESSHKGCLRENWKNKYEVKAEEWCKSIRHRLAERYRCLRQQSNTRCSRAVPALHGLGGGTWCTAAVSCPCPVPYSLPQNGVLKQLPSWRLPYQILIYWFDCIWIAS